MSDGGLSDLKHEFKGERGDLIPVLQRVQALYGYLLPDTVRAVSRWLKISENEIFGVATFYAQFRFHPPGRHHVRVCLGTACHVKGGEQILLMTQQRLGIGTGETTADGKYDLERVACLGCCALAPVVTFDEKIYSQMSVLKVQRILDEHKSD
ncbi:MAG: NADH-quinone oxidoreductase subunit NuoE [Candidatus Aminicenantes bacterium]|nr:NADH-quinone oxidoreductase subunit NuoE [Candidatus Aminicenantes bacterium]